MPAFDAPAAVMTTPVTALYAALCVVLVLALAWRVVSERRRARIGLGDGGDPALQRAIAVHRNAIEYLPLALLLLLTAELNGAEDLLLHGLGATLLVARVVHAIGLSRSGGTSFGRFHGTLFTWLVLLALVVVNLVVALG